MREILFRGKRTNSDEWVEGFYYIKRCKYAGMEKILHEYATITTGIAETSGAYGERTTTVEYTVVPETVGQYTGLTDKHGTKIFEGDIIKQEFRLNGAERAVKSVIEYGIDHPYHRACGVCQRFSDGSGSAIVTVEMKNGVVFCEVIGNIHDNPELMKGE